MVVVVVDLVLVLAVAVAELVAATAGGGVAVGAPSTEVLLGPVSYTHLTLPTILRV